MFLIQLAVPFMSLWFVLGIYVLMVFTWHALLVFYLLCLNVLCFAYFVSFVGIWPAVFVCGLICVFGLGCTCMYLAALLALGLQKSTVGLHSFVLFAQFALGHRNLTTTPSGCTTSNMLATGL